MRALILPLLVAITSSGCAAPGSALGHLGFSGAVSEPNSAAPLTIAITLPRDYGLGGLDRAFGKPEDYGHKDHTVTTAVSEGTFTVEFPPVVYHVTFWLLPPLGAYPKRPPAPVYYVSFSDAPEEVYLVGMKGEEFDYRVFDRASRQARPKTAAAWSIVDGKYLLVDSAGKKVWHLRITITKPRPASGPAA